MTYVRMQTFPGVENLPFEHMKSGQTYTLIKPTAEQHMAAWKAAQAVAAPKGMRVISYAMPNENCDYRLVVDKSLPQPPKIVRPRGRPLSDEMRAIEALEIGQVLTLRRGDKSLQVLRNSLSRASKRFERYYRGQASECGGSLIITRLL